MVEKLADRFFSFANKFTIMSNSGDRPYSSLEIIDQIQDAKNEWITARAYFENVTDPDLVDYSIYALEAAEKKYMYLLKRAKEMGIASTSMYYCE